MSTRKPILVVAGPTASGKSKFSMECARALNGEILSIDSVQVYRGLDIGSAKISSSERASIPHYLLDIRNPDASFNVADFLGEAQRALTAIEQRGKTCVACAGTTLYLTALLHGLVEAPAQDGVYRAKLESLSDGERHELLAQLDPISAARLHRNDRTRVTRALETIHVSGKALSDLQSEHAYSTLVHPALIIVMCWSRRALYARIDERARLMISSGLLEETERVMQDYPGAHQALRTLGYAQAQSCLSGALPKEALADEIAMQTRRYAKRQMTYWRNEPLKRKWHIHPQDDESGVDLADPTPATRGRSVKSFRVLSMSSEDLIRRIQIGLAQVKDSVELWYVDAEKLGS